MIVCDRCKRSDVEMLDYWRGRPFRRGSSKANLEKLALCFDCAQYVDDAIQLAIENRTVASSYTLPARRSPLELATRIGAFVLVWLAVGSALVFLLGLLHR